MNYFSHFFVDHRPGRHEFNTGLLLPDVTRKTVKRFTERPSYNNLHREFLAGCLTHYEADKAFHTSSFFTALLARSSGMINAAGFSGAVQRKWFLAHILAELMIDRVLVKERPRELDAFYRSLDLADREALASFLELNGLEDKDTFFGFFDHFRKVQYIYYYADNNKFVYSLNRIMMRAGVGEMSGEDQAVLKDVVLELESSLAGNEEVLIGQLIQSRRN